MSIRTRQGLVTAFAAILTLVVAIGESGTHVHHNTTAFLILGLTVTWSFMVAGLVAWTRRPANRIGPLMCATGLAWLTNGLTDSPNALLATLGYLGTGLWLALLIHLMLAYPSGSVGSRRARWLTIAVYLDVWGLALLALPFMDPRTDGSSPGSARNLLMVDHSHNLVLAVDYVAVAVGIVLAVCILWILVGRWRSATAAARRILAPVYLTGAICLVTIIVLAVVSVGGDVGDAPFYVFAITLSAIPQSFLYGLLRTQIGRSSAVSALIGEVESSGRPEELRDALRRALGDPTVELVYWLPENGLHVDLEGQVLPPQNDDGRTVTTIDRSGTRVLQMVHDRSLLEDKGLLDATASAAAISLRSRALATELEAQIREAAASQRRLSELLERVRLIAVSLDTDGLITYVNTFLCELTGWSEGQLLGRDWLEVFNGTEVQFLERMANDNVLPYEENWIRTRSGEILEIAWNNTVIRDRDGRIIGATSIGEDITLRKRNERRMGFQLAVARALAGADRLEQVAEPLVDALAAAFPCWAVVYWKAEPGHLMPIAVWGLPDQVPAGFTDAVRAARPSDDSALAAFVRERGEPRWDVDVDDDPVMTANELRPPSGSYAFPIMANGAVDAVVQLCSSDDRPPDDEMRGLLEAAGDRIGQLIERRRAELAVARSEARKSAVLDSALDCIITIDGDNRIVEFNPSAEATFGRAAADVVGKDMAELLIPERFRERHRRGVRRQVEDGDRGRFLGSLIELTGMRADGSEFPIELSVTRVETGQGPQFTAFIRDITQRKQAAEELRRSRARIVAAGDEARRRLERNLHDGAQQRLVSLSLSLRLAQTQFQRDPSSADAILDAARDELSQALEELRELARGIHPAILTDRGLRPALEALAARAPVDVQLASLPEEALPPAVEAAAYYIVAESLTNIAKYAEARTATVRIVRDGVTARIEVSDDGIGGADPAGGSGLRGLADRVESLDGTLQVESPLGGGTRVTAVIPCE